MSHEGWSEWGSDRNLWQGWVWGRSLSVKETKVNRALLTVFATVLHLDKSCEQWKQFQTGSSETVENLNGWHCIRISEGASLASESKRFLLFPVFQLSFLFPSHIRFFNIYFILVFLSWLGLGSRSSPCRWKGSIGPSSPHYDSAFIRT